MGIHAKEKEVFLKYKGRIIIALESKPAHDPRTITGPFYFVDQASGNRFDIRDLPMKYVGWVNAIAAIPRKRCIAVHRADVGTLTRVLKKAIDDGYDFKVFATPMDAFHRIREEFYHGSYAANTMVRIAQNAMETFGSGGPLPEVYRG